MDELVKTWLDLDRDEETRNEINQLYRNNDIRELDVRLRTSKSIGYGALFDQVFVYDASGDGITVGNPSDPIQDSRLVPQACEPVWVLVSLELTA